MAKALRKEIKIVKSFRDLEAHQLALSNRHGGAWVGDIMPYSMEVHFFMYASPSKVPDSFIESGNPFYDPKIAYKGRLYDFTKAAKIREQNRGVGGDR